MEQIKLKAVLRKDEGKQAVKKLRQSGWVPAVVYRQGENPVSISLAGKEISRIAHDHGNENILINLTVEKEKKSRAVILKEIQSDPVKQDILHVDFHEISLTQKITVEVEVAAKGEPVGVKMDGGFLDHPLREVRIQCLPADIPPHLDVDVSALKLGDALYVKDLVVSAAIKILTDPQALLFQVKKHEEKVEEAVPVEAPEVEVIREKKEGEAAPAAEKKEGRPAAGAEKK